MGGLIGGIGVPPGMGTNPNVHRMGAGCDLLVDLHLLNHSGRNRRTSDTNSNRGSNRRFQETFGSEPVEPARIGILG